MKYKKILMIDNFDSFTFNLVDYFQQLGCEVVVYRNDIEVEKVREVDPDLIVLSPGPSVPKNAGNLMAIIAEYADSYPVFGVCLGHEALVEHFGGSLKFVTPVHGKSSPINHDSKGIFEGMEQDFAVGRYHSLVADEVPDCFEVSAKTGELVMAIRHKELPILAVQFHPESILSMKGGNGFQLIKNLVS
jgi:anthranilate synthase/aminodeoxychorismate synthase-like glutamine amidotransferase